MKKSLAENKRIVSGEAQRKVFAAVHLTDEELCKAVRSAVKRVSVPANLESKLRNLLGQRFY